MNSVHHSRFHSGLPAGFNTCFIVIAIGLLLTGAPAVFAQSIFANLSGTVTDNSGAVVSGARISVQNTQTQVITQFVTNSAGFFSATQLPTGTYNVTAEAKGFKKWQGTGIVLTSSESKTVNISLQIGAANETVEVTASAGEIAITDTGEKSDLVTSEQLDHLSLVGRNATEYLKILPGAALSANGGVNKLGYTGEVVGINGFSVGGSAGGLGGVTINGQTGLGISITQDGQNVQDPGAPGAATPVNPNPDMISELKVLTSNYSAESAKGPIVVNTISKSGGRSFHGDVHFYARNSAMNTEDSFNKAIESDPGSGYKPGQLKIPSNYYYPGFTFGGPVLIPGTGFNKARNKYFFHESFENYRQLIDGGVDRAFVPTADMLNGDFSALATWANLPGRFGMSNVPSGTVSARPGCSITGGVLSPECISPLAQQYMLNALPAPTSAAPDSHGFNYIAPVQERQNSTHNLVRGDMNFTENTKAYVSWSRQRETANMPLGLWNNPGDWVIPAPSPSIGANTSDFYAVNFLHMFSPTLTVEARFGYTHIDFPTTPSNPSKVLRSEMNFPQQGVFANPNAPVALSWGQSIPTLGDIGHDYHPTMIATKGIPSSGGDVTKVFKSHTAKFGAFWEHGYNKQDNWGQYMGVYTYSPWSNQVSGNNYSDMLMGVGFSGYFEQALPPAINSAANNMSFYATDHWKLTRRITVDYGLRFEHYGASYPDTRYGVAVFDRNKYQNGVMNSGISWHSLDHSVPLSGNAGNPILYSPRVGASIDLFGNGQTVVRGGWGQYRYGNYVGASSGPAATAMGSTGWGCGSSADCLTWESIDSHISDGSGSCAAGANCAPSVVYGQETDFTNTSPSVTDPHNHDTTRTTSYSLNIDQQLPKKFMFEASYVGSHTDFIQNGFNINAVPVGALSDSAQVQARCPSNPDPNNGTCQQQFRPFPNYTGISATESAGKSQYDGLQSSLTRSSGWLTLVLNYTFSKSYANSPNTATAAFRDYGVSEYWSVQQSDRTHVFNAAYVFSLPKLGMGNRILRGAVNGWEFSGITQVQSGVQITANTGSNLGLQGASGGVALVGTPDVTPSPALLCNPSHGLTRGRYVNPSCFTLPSAGGIGNGRFPYIAGPMFWNSDVTLVKRFSITEHQNLEFRFAAFNFLNHALTSFSNGDNNLKLNFDSSGQLTNATDTQHACPGPTCTAFGYPDYHYGHRIVEVGAKYSF